MPMQNISIPPYTLQKPQQNTMSLIGLFPAGSEEAGLYFRQRIEPIRAAGQRYVDNSGADIPSDVLYIITSNFSSTLRTFLVYENGPIRELSIINGQRTITEITGMGDSTFYRMFNFEGISYALSSDNEIYAFTGGVNSSPVREQRSDEMEDGVNLKDVLTDIGVNVDFKTLRVWQGRLFVTYGRTLIWSDTGNICEWRESYLTDPDNVNSIVETNAGNELFESSSEIKEIAVSNTFFYVFLENEVYKTQVLDVDTQFGFTPLHQNVVYTGGAVGTRRGLFFFTDTGLYNLLGEDLRKISDHIDPALRNTQNPNLIVSTLVEGEDVFWCFRDLEGLMIAYNFVHDSANIIDKDFSFIGRITSDIETINEVSTPINQKFTLINTAPELNTLPRAFRINNRGRLFEYTFGKDTNNNRLRFNLTKNKGNERVNIMSISIPDLETPALFSSNEPTRGAYRIDIRDSASNEVKTFSPDSRGAVYIYSEFVSPDIEIYFPTSGRSDLTISSIDIDYEIVGV